MKDEKVEAKLKADGVVIAKAALSLKDRKRAAHNELRDQAALVRR
jgi:hypothetical protein